MNPKQGKNILLAAAAILLMHMIIRGNSLFNGVDNTSSKIDSTQTTDTKDKVDKMISRVIEKQLSYIAKPNEDIVSEGEDMVDLGTTTDHWQNLGIKNAQLSSDEEKELYLIVIRSIKGQLEYFSTRNNQSLEVVRGLYFQKEFEKYKDDTNRKVSTNDVQSGYESYEEIKTIRFSKPRTYEGLPDTIGIVSYIGFNDQKANRLISLYILKKYDSEWKIEKQGEMAVRLEELEDALIKEIHEAK